MNEKTAFQISAANRSDYSEPSLREKSSVQDSYKDQGYQPESSPVAPLSHDFYLKDWFIEPSSNQISCNNGQAVTKTSLEPRLMLLLSYLAANSGKVLSRQELTTKIWPKVIVNENSLTRAISELRKQLNSTTTQGTSGSYIDTIPKKGYRLAVKVTQGVKQSNPHQSQDSNYESFFETSSASGIYARQGRKIAAGWRPNTLVASILLAMIFSITQFQQLNPFSPSTPNSVLPVADTNVTPSNPFLDVYSGNYFDTSIKNQSEDPQLSKLTQLVNVYEKSGNQESQPTISPDGKLIAFIECNSTNSSIFVGSIDQSRPMIEVFTSDPSQEIFNLQWSPLDNALLFARKTKFNQANLFTEEGIFGNSQAELVMLDLNDREITVLYNGIEEPNSLMNGHI